MRKYLTILTLFISSFCFGQNEMFFAQNVNQVITYKGYGYLYNWYAASNANFAPTGWHVSTYSEYADLATYLGGESIAGGHLKESGTVHWNTPNTDADNSSGFTALPGGFRNEKGDFADINDKAYFWSATEYDPDHALFRILTYDKPNIEPAIYFPKTVGLSVRCLRD